MSGWEEAERAGSRQTRLPFLPLRAGLLRPTQISMVTITERLHQDGWGPRDHKHLVHTHTNQGASTRTFKPTPTLATERPMGLDTV